jgi:hypothetical protein
MQRINADALFQMALHLERFTHGIPNPEPFNDTTRQNATSAFEYFKKNCTLMGLTVSALYIDRILTKVKEPTCSVDDIRQMCPILQDRINDEMRSIYLMHIPTKNAAYLKDKQHFGQEVLNKFPSSAFDIEESGKCLAFNRNTASVMHLMRVMEVALKAAATALSIPNPGEANWQRIIDQINSQISQRGASKPPDQMAMESFFKEVSAHLFAVKNAWRNPVMHIHQNYDAERAGDIFNAVKGFMRYLAIHLDESGKFTP